MIKLIKNYPYDNKYDFIKLFPTKSEQDQYFNNFSSIKIDEENDGYIKEGETFIIEYNYDYLMNEGVNYVIWNNGYKDMYCFIYKKEYVDDESTRIYFEVDVLNTFCFDINIKKSFIERKNCLLDEVADYDEGFNIGEHIIDSEVTSLEKYYSYYAMFNGFKNQDLVFTDGKLTDVKTFPIATVRPLTTIDGIQYPLHFMELKSEYLEPAIQIIDTGGSGGNTVGGDWKNGLVSASCFRFLKGMEGFAPSPYQDVSGYWTIAYGVAKHGAPNEYAILESQAPISEQIGAMTSYNLKNNNYGKPIVQRCKELGITKQCQFDALTSLAYNCGIGVIIGDNELTRAIKSAPNNELVIRPVFEKFYITSGGVEYEGLKQRRIQECNMYFGKDFEKRAIPLINSSGNIIGTLTENNGDGWLPS